MASYESTAADVMESISSSDLSATTQAAIATLLGEMTTAPVIETIETGTLTSGMVTGDTNVVMMGKDTNADVVFAPDSPVKIITVGGLGNSNVEFQTTDDVVVALQGGWADSVSTGAGNDTISIQGGSAAVNTGSGNDTVAITGGEADILAGDGDLTVQIDANAAGNATINAGDGFDLVRMVSSVVEHTFKFINGVFTMNSDYELQMKDVNVVGFDATGDGILNTATVLADTAAESLVGKLYTIALGRTEGGALDSGTTQAAQMGGIKFWTDQYAADVPAEDQLQQTVYSFLNCDEFHNQYDAMNNLQYVTSLFENLGLDATASVGGKSIADYVNVLGGYADQNIGRYDVAWSIAASNEAVTILGADGDKFVIDADGMDLGNPLA